jgi:hypothetical protein
MSALPSSADEKSRDQTIMRVIINVQPLDVAILRRLAISSSQVVPCFRLPDDENCESHRTFQGNDQGRKAVPNVFEKGPLLKDGRKAPMLHDMC